MVYADPSSPEGAEKAERWFRELAEKANLTLSECGFALCKGGVMARNPKWRGPLGEWKKTLRRWVIEPEAQRATKLPGNSLGRHLVPEGLARVARERRR